MLCRAVLHVQVDTDDPFDALANILPSAESITRPQPVYTGSEVPEVHPV